MFEEYAFLEDKICNLHVRYQSKITRGRDRVTLVGIPGKSTKKKMKISGNSSEVGGGSW